MAVEQWKLYVGEGGGWKSYLWALNRFCEFTGKTPDQLITERNREIISPIKEERLRADNMVIQFYQWMRKKKYLPGTCTMAYNAVRSFYAANDVALTKKKPKAFKGTPETAAEPVKPEDIPKIISAAETDCRKAVISFLAESGCRPAILTALKVKDVSDQLDREVAVIKIPAVFRNYLGENVNKAQVAHKICVTRRTLHYVASSLKNRNVKPNTQLFPFSIRTINYIVENAAVKAGLNKVSPRSFRKTFNDIAIASGVAYELKEFLMGHKIQSTQAAYFGSETDIINTEIVKAYNKIVKNLLR